MPFNLSGMFGGMFGAPQQQNDPHQTMLQNNRAARHQRMNPGQNMQAMAPQQRPGQQFGQMFQNWQQSNPMQGSPMSGMFANIFGGQGNGLNPQQQQQMNVDRAKYGLAPGQTLGGQGWQSQAGNQNPYQPPSAPQPQPATSRPQTTNNQQQPQTKPNTRGNYSR